MSTRGAHVPPYFLSASLLKAQLDTSKWYLERWVRQPQHSVCQLNSRTCAATGSTHTQVRAGCTAQRTHMSLQHHRLLLYSLAG